MAGRRSVLVLFVSLLLALFVFTSAEGVLDTAYDESAPVASTSFLAARMVESTAKAHDMTRLGAFRRPTESARAVSAPELLGFTPNGFTRFGVALRC